MKGTKVTIKNYLFEDIINQPILIFVKLIFKFSNNWYNYQKETKRTKKTKKNHYKNRNNKC